MISQCSATVLEVSEPTLELLKQGRFEEAASSAVAFLRGAEDLTDAARSLVASKGIFPNAAQAAASLPYFRAVFSTLQELAGPDSGAAMAAAANLAGVLASADHVSEAIAVNQRVYDYVRARFPADDHRLLLTRDTLAFLYRRAGLDNQASVLYRDTGICEHLAPVERLLRDRGDEPYSCGRPWSDNCHLWTFFDGVLDCEQLIRTLQLDPCVRIHDHRGTHDGSERGLVCTLHHDAVIGRHPLDAGPNPKRLPR